MQEKFTFPYQGQEKYTFPYQGQEKSIVARLFFLLFSLSLLFFFNLTH